MTATLLALVVLAGEAPAPPAISTWLPTILVALIAAAGVTFGAWVTLKVKKLNRPVDDATVLKTHVEADKLRAEVDRARIDNDGREVEIARGLLDDIRKELDRYRTEMDRVRAESQKQIDRIVEHGEKQHAEVVGQLDAVRSQQTQLREKLEAHIPWDLAAHELLRQTHSDFPEPPPVHFD